MKAAMNGHLEIVEQLLTFGANPRISDAKGETALTLACVQENYKVCERLLIAKADVNQRDPQGRTPLLKSALHNSKSDIIKLLLGKGADPDIADNDLNTPLHFAAIRGAKDVALFLIKVGANPYAVNMAANVPYEEVNRPETLPYFKVCYVCRRQGEQPCKNCGVVYYCGIECQRKDYQLHQRKLCPIFQNRRNEAALKQLKVLASGIAANLDDVHN